ncbi:MAG: sensor histidine kinase [Bacilli bacterium]
MTIYNIIFMNFAWILFPIMLFLIYEAYSENINTKQNELFLNFCLISAIYLIIRCGTFENYKRTIEIMLDSTLITLYLKKSKKGALVTSLLGIIIIINLKLEIIPVIIKYILYFYSYKIYKNKQNYNIILSYVIRLFFLITIILITNMQKNELIEYISYYILTYLIIIFLIKAEKIIEIHISYKELMKEYQLRESLFKISHEIKNPIAVCKGYLDMCKSSENYERYLPILKSEIDKTLNLLQDFSACNKIKIERDIIDISLLIEDITNNLKLMFTKQNIKFIIEPLQEEIYINGDYNRLNQVLLNIIKNSIEAKDEKKQSYVKLYTKLNQKNIKIYIEDNGVGISKENMKKISEPFFTTKQNGTGLGVLLSKEIITAHDGKIEYKSKENTGTIVTITLPIIEY